MIAAPAPLMTPPAIPPTKFPIAVPISLKLSPPSARISLKPGILASNPAAVTTAAITPMNAARPRAPLIASAEGILLTIRHAADNARRSTDKLAAVSIEGLTSKSLSAITIPVIMPTMPVRTSSQPTALMLTASVLMPEAIFVMRANAIIRLNRAPVALARSFPSIKDSATTAAAITPTVVVRAIMFCLTFEAPLVAQIIAVIQALRPAITANGFFMSTSFI